MRRGGKHKGSSRGEVERKGVEPSCRIGFSVGKGVDQGVGIDKLSRDSAHAENRTRNTADQQLAQLRFELAGIGFVLSEQSPHFVQSHI